MIRRGRAVRTTSPARTATGPVTCSIGSSGPGRPNLVWIADFTYCRTWAGLVYVSFIVDVFAQRIVGWHAATNRRTDLVLIPLQIALWDRDRARPPRRGPGKLIASHDAGIEYTSLRFTEHLALEGIAPSVGTVGDAYDNGLMESVIGLFKTECIRTRLFHRGPYRPSPTSSTPSPAGSTGTTTGGHTDPRNVPPEEYEQAHYAALNPQEQPAPPMPS